MYHGHKIWELGIALVRVWNFFLCVINIFWSKMHGIFYTVFYRFFQSFGSLMSTYNITMKLSARVQPYQHLGWRNVDRLISTIQKGFPLPSRWSVKQVEIYKSLKKNFHRLSRHTRTYCKNPHIKMYIIEVFMADEKSPKVDLGCPSFSSHFSFPDL